MSFALNALTLIRCINHLILSYNIIIHPHSHLASTQTLPHKIAPHTVYVTRVYFRNECVQFPHILLCVMITNEVGLRKAHCVTLDECIDLCGVCPGTSALDSYSPL